MRRLRGALRFAYEFVVGDDPALAIAVVVALGITAAVAAAGPAAWWVLPMIVLATLSWSVLRAGRSPTLPPADTAAEPDSEGAGPRPGLRP